MDLSLLEYVPNDKIMSRYCTNNEMQRLNVEMLVNFNAHQCWISKEDPGFLLCFDPYRGLYKVFATDKASFQKGINNVKFEPNSHDIVIRVNKDFSSMMQLVLERNGYQIKKTKYTVRAGKGSDLPPFDSLLLMTEGVKKGDVSLASFINEHYTNPVFGKENNLKYITHVLKNYPSSVIYDENGNPIAVQCTHTDGFQGLVNVIQGGRVPPFIAAEVIHHPELDAKLEGIGHYGKVMEIVVYFHAVKSPAKL